MGGNRRMRIVLLDIDGTLLLTNRGGSSALQKALSLEFWARSSPRPESISVGEPIDRFWPRFSGTMTCRTTKTISVACGPDTRRSCPKYFKSGAAELFQARLNSLSDCAKLRISVVMP